MSPWLDEGNWTDEGNWVAQTTSHQTDQLTDCPTDWNTDQPTGAINSFAWSRRKKSFFSFSCKKGSISWFTLRSSERRQNCVSRGYLANGLCSTPLHKWGMKIDSRENLLWKQTFYGFQSFTSACPEFFSSYATHSLSPLSFCVAVLLLLLIFLLSFAPSVLLLLKVEQHYSSNPPKFVLHFSWARVSCVRPCLLLFRSFTLSWEAREEAKAARWILRFWRSPPSPPPPSRRADAWTDGTSMLSFIGPPSWPLPSSFEYRILCRARVLLIITGPKSTF